MTKDYEPEVKRLQNEGHEKRVLFLFVLVFKQHHIVCPSYCKKRMCHALKGRNFST